MNYGTGFSSGTANPLYNPSTPVRITKTALTAAGVFFASRIDQDTLQHSKDIVDAGVTVDGLSVLAATDKLYSDDSSYLASLDCQHLRIETAALASYANDAFVWGDTSTPAFGSAGSRACFVDDSASSAGLLRSGSCACRTALNNSYAAAIGFAETACALAPGPFFEILRLGGSLAEAAAVAIEKLDYTAVTIGSPTMTVSFELGGYNLYHGLGGPEAINWTSPITFARAGVGQLTVPLTLEPGIKHVLTARAVSERGVEERNTRVLTYAEVANDGTLLAPPLARPSDLTAALQPNGAVLVGFSCYSAPGADVASEFEILTDRGTGVLDIEEPIASISSNDGHQTDFEALIIPEALPAKFAVRGREGDRSGPLSRTVTVRPPETPEPPVLL